MADNMVETYSSTRHLIQDVLCRCIPICSIGVSPLWWKAFPYVTAVSSRIKRETQEATGGWLCYNNMFFMLPH
ncbi:hypothetical protein RND71_007207 [Anisodus tanguticus]|uniref:Uncharacterized protein n=1 Tax=Anisodus tanguticus TaxID=243964 RepID=A0AAE1SLY2_9SOLA|nr:hypothetical protein RND71_007207 [Anisodus tanguticus]